MAGFSDQQYAGQFRDLITRIARRVVREERPDVKIGKVYSYDKTTQYAKILFAGETIDNLVKVRAALNMQPTQTMEIQFPTLGYDAPGDIVRVAGKPGSYYITDFYSGVPGLTGPPREGVHGNPDFELWSLQGKTSGQSTYFPSEWTPFWQDDSTINEQSTDRVSGAYSVKITRAAGASGNAARLHSSTVFAVTPGDTVSFEIYMKASDVAGYVGVAMISSDTVTGAEFFSGNPVTQVNEKNINLSTDWRKYNVAYVVPNGHYYARFSLWPTTLNNSLTISYWFDDSGSAVTTPATGQQAVSGEIKMWPGVTAPSGYLLCNGAIFNNTDYPALAAILGTTFGGVAGTSFAVPDFRGRLPLGSSSTVALNSNEGVAEASRNLSHTHTATIVDHIHFSGTYVANDTSLTQATNTTTGGTANRLTSPVSHGHGIGGKSGVVENNPSFNTGNQPNTGTNSIPYLGINFIIKT